MNLYPQAQIMIHHVFVVFVEFMLTEQAQK